MFRACAAPRRIQLQEEEDNESFSYLLGTATPDGSVTFGTVQVYDRELTDGETLCKLEPLLRDRSYGHPAKLKKLSSKLAAECAADRAQDLIEQIKEEQLEENGHFAKETARLSREESETQPQALSVHGSGEWTIDSGSSFYIYSQHDMGKGDKRKAYTLANPSA
jgi:hypothetical protein